jgi:hypothetical protein
MSSESSSGSLSSFEEAATSFMRKRKAKQEQGQTKKKKGGGSKPGKRKNKERNRLLYDALLKSDYFNDETTYDANDFRRRFRMRRHVFDRILNALVAHDDYFKQKADCCKVLGFSPHQKITCALQFLAYGKCADELDEFIRMGESTVFETLRRFCKGIIECFGTIYLRPPNVEDLQKILKEYEKKGWIGCMGCIDVMKWTWKNCPMAWRGAYQGKEKKPTIALEAVVDSRLYFWHAFFGVPGANNDLNVLDCSPLFKDILSGTASEVTFLCNNEVYKMGYYLADGIYPDWQMMMKTIPEPQTRKQKYFATKQEGRRKDVERGYAAIQVSCRVLLLLCFALLWFSH